jgi:hypothetical protein
MASVVHSRTHSRVAVRRFTGFADRSGRGDTQRAAEGRVEHASYGRATSLVWSHSHRPPRTDPGPVVRQPSLRSLPPTEDALVSRPRIWLSVPHQCVPSRDNRRPRVPSQEMKQSHLIAVAALATLGLLLLLNNPGLRDEAHSRLPRRMHHSSGPQHIKHKKEGQHNEAFDHAGFDPEVPTPPPLPSPLARNVAAPDSRGTQVAHHSGEYEEEYPDAMEENWREDDEWWDEHYDEQHGGFNISHRLEVLPRTTPRRFFH